MWSWHLAQPTVSPRKAEDTVSTATIGNSSPTWLSRTTAPRALNPAIQGKAYNDARSGALMRDLNGQMATVVAQRVDYVTVLMGGNDVCQPTEAQMTDAVLFESQFKAAMDTLTAGSPGTRVSWVTRRAAGFAGEVAADSLPARAALYAEGRRLQAGGSPAVRWLGGGECEGIEYNSATHRYRALFATGSGARAEEADQVIVNCGHGPDSSLYRELRVHECYESLAPMKLAAALQGAGTGDCTQIPAFGAELLANPEPDFFIVGAKSYGRSSDFLLQTGFRQAADVLARLAESAGLRAPQEA